MKTVKNTVNSSCTNKLIQKALSLLLCSREEALGDVDPQKLLKPFFCARHSARFCGDFR